MKDHQKLLIPLILAFILLLAVPVLGWLIPASLEQPWFLPGAAGTLVLLGLWMLQAAYRGYIRPARSFETAAKAIADGKAANKSVAFLRGQAGRTARSLVEVGTMVRQAEEFARAIGNGQNEVEWKQDAGAGPLGEALMGMKAQLNRLAEAEARRTWANAGTAQFASLIQEEHSDLRSFGHRFVNELCAYMEVDVGACFLHLEESRETVQLAGAYACSGEDFGQADLQLEGTLLGQAMADRKVAIARDIPEGYLKAVSGLGRNQPTHLVICPIMTSDQVWGALELASFKPVAPYRIAWLEQVCEDVAGKVSVIQNNLKTQQLLAQTQRSNALLQEQEDRLVQQASELLAAQENLESQYGLLEDEMAYSRSMAAAIDKSYASIELDLEGNITKANEMYCGVMGMSQEEIVGKAEAELVTEKDLEGGQYQMMWESLQVGAHFSGEFRRQRKDGGEVWFSGSYGPVLNAKGETIRIVKFARVVSGEKEKDLVVKGQMKAVAQALPAFFLSPSEQILSPNPQFSKLSGYKRLELKKVPFHKFLEGDARGLDLWEGDLPRLFEDGQLLDFSAQLTFADGKPQQFRIVMGPIQDLNGLVTRAYVLLVATPDTSPSFQENSLPVLETSSIPNQ